MSMKIIAPIAAGVLLAMAGSAQAATKSTTFQVTATVAENCVVTATSLAFGTFDSVTNRFANSNVAVNCTAGTNFEVALNDGLNGLDLNNRQMTGPGPQTLLYNLYSDLARSTVWNAINTQNGVGAGMATPVNFPVYGELLASLNQDRLLDEGAYSDTVTATITY